jgi:hypothetical protein
VDNTVVLHPGADCERFIAVPSDGDQKPRLLSLVKELQLANNVVFLNEIG